MAEVLLSNWSETVKAVPANYILPPERRPKVFSVCKDIPLIDLERAEANEEGRADLLEQMLKAGYQYGAFQVINHGITKEIEEARTVCLDLFKKQDDEKKRLYCEEIKDGLRLHTSGHNYSTEEIHYWKDTLNLPCDPLEQHIQSWPKSPPQFREAVGTYSGEVKKLGLRIVDVICAGLGLEGGYFAKAEYSRKHGMMINLYPPCPDPSVTLGLGEHVDPYVITLIQQDAYGLQVTKKDGQWVGVDVVPDAFIVIIGSTLEIVSNGRVRSCVHRVVTNPDVDRLTILSFLYPDFECVIATAQELVNAKNPPLYEPYKYIDFLEHYQASVKKRITPLTHQ